MTSLGNCHFPGGAENFNLVFEGFDESTGGAWLKGLSFPPAARLTVEEFGLCMLSGSLSFAGGCDDGKETGVGLPKEDVFGRAWEFMNPREELGAKVSSAVERDVWGVAPEESGAEVLSIFSSSELSLTKSGSYDSRTDASRSSNASSIPS